MAVDTKAAQQRMEDPAGALAVNLLAYNDMGRLDDVERLLLEAHRNSFGRVISIWYQMCVSERGTALASADAKSVAGSLQAKLDSIPKNLAYNLYKEQGLPLSYARGLLLNLANGQEEQFGELWLNIAEKEPDKVVVETCLILMGFALSVLNANTSADCE